MKSLAITIRIGQPIAAAFATFINEGIRNLPVIKDQQEIIGIFSDRDIQDMVAIDVRNPEKNKEYSAPGDIAVFIANRKSRSGPVQPISVFQPLGLQ